MGICGDMGPSVDAGTHRLARVGGISMLLVPLLLGVNGDDLAACGDG